MSNYLTSINGQGGSTLSGSTITNTGMRAEDHMHFSEDFLSSAGVPLLGTNLRVSQKGTPNMSVDIAAGTGYVLNTNYTASSATQQRFFRGKADATTNVVISANASGNPRVTSIFVKIDVAATPDANGSNVMSFVAVDGTPAGSPVAPSSPADGNSYLRLANVAVANGASSIVDANITDMRVLATTSYNDSGWTELPYTFTSSTGNLVFPTGFDPRVVLNVGDGIRLYDGAGTTYEYFYVIAVSSTTATLNAGSSYALAGTPTNVAYTKNPATAASFPATFNFAAAPTGFGSTPANGNYTFTLTGRIVDFKFTHDQTTSNSTGYTFTLPITAAATAGKAFFIEAIDNSASTMATAVIAGSSATCSLYKTSSVTNLFGNWTAANLKLGIVSGTYRI